MKILLTGGAGFIGSHVCDAFIDCGHDVVVLDNLSSGREENVNRKALLVEGDISDHDFISSLFDTHNFDVVNHHAAQMDVRRSVADPVFDANINIIAMLNLLKESVRTNVKKFMFASTGGAIYGEQEYFPADEKHPTMPLSPYGVSKLAGEAYIRYFNAQYGLNYCITRYANVYGPRQNPHGEAGVVAIFSNQLVKGHSITINGDGKQTRDFVNVYDVARANVLGLNYNNDVCVNIGTGIETDVVTLFDFLAKSAGTSMKPTFGPAMPGEQRRSVITPEYAKQTIGWEPAKMIEEGLRETYLYFKTDGLPNEPHQVEK